MGDFSAHRSQQIKKRLGELLPDNNPGDLAVHQAMRYSCLGEGKMVRPTLCLLVHEAAGNPNPAFCLDAACAVEMVHCSSLILDDLPSMDDAQLRRGQFTTHKQFGVDTAILAAVGLLNLAFKVVADSEHGDAESRLQIISILNTAIGSDGLIGGQENDLNLFRGNGSVTDIDTVNWMKTGILFASAAEIGSVAAKSGPETRAAFRRFAGHIGCAFQTVDDMIDKTGTIASAGKDIDKDNGKATLVRTDGLSQSKSAARQQIDLAFEELSNCDIESRALEAYFSKMFSRYIDE
ncbi:MAG: polyprenyl synthetase family protein [Rhizobiaceae bacterium]